MDCLDDRLDALLTLRRDPFLDGPLGAHGLVETLRQRDAHDPLALLAQTSFEQRDFLPQGELLGRVVAKQGVGHVVVRAEPLARIWLPEKRFEYVLDPVFGIGHATIPSAY